MKRFIAFFLTLILSFSLAACSNGTGQKDTVLNTEPLKEESTENNETDTFNDILVVYFSATGTTKSLAEYAADILDADKYEIVPDNPYTEEDLAYYTNGRAEREQNDSSARPAISGGVENIQKYDTILLGYPIWHGQAPRIISTFLESYDFSGKTILPFCTSHSSDIETSAANLHPLAENANWLDGKRFASGTTREEVERWLGNLEIKSSQATNEQKQIGVFDFDTKQ